MGKTLQVILKDNQSNGDDSERVARELIEQDKVHVIMGAGTSSNSLRVAALAQAAGVIQIAHTSTLDGLTEVGDHIFRACFKDSFQGELMAAFALENNWTQVAIMHPIGDGTAFNVGLAQNFERAFTDNGGGIVITETYDLTDTDFQGQLAAIKNSGAQAIFLPSYVDDGAEILTQARDAAINITLPFLGADGWANNRITQAVKDNAFYSVHFNAGDPCLTFSAQTFVDNFQTQFGMPPGSRAALGYDAVRIYARAVEGGENLSTEQIRQRLSQTSNYAGATEILRLDQNRNPIKSAVIMKIEDRVEAFHQSVRP